MFDGFVVPYGANKYKVKLAALQPPRGKLVLVTAINPTPYGEGKTTITIGLADALNKLRPTIAALREPSLGPVFGLKGGATGGGKAQLANAADINLHFTGDFHAIGAANNLLCALIDNHIYQGNALHIDTRRIVARRCVDMNDRQLRAIVSGLAGQGQPREEGYDITVATEMMAVFCMATSIADLKERISRMVVAYDVDGKPITPTDLRAVGALAALLADALRPNLVHTLEGTPALVHGGPFANIAHGCNSVLATRMALGEADYVVTEAGFGADLGAEKFIDIKCRMNGLVPSAVVLVTTIRALKTHGGGNLRAGLANLERHLHNLRNVWGLPTIVALNRFPEDTDEEIAAVGEAIECNAFTQGSEGMKELASAVAVLCEQPLPTIQYPYELTATPEEKIRAIVRNIYGGTDIIIEPKARRKLRELKTSNLPVCIAKTQYSFSDNPKLLGAPTDFKLTVKDVRLAAGAGFIVVLTGDIMTMPGLPKVPAAESIDVNDDGVITGIS